MCASARHSDCRVPAVLLLDARRPAKTGSSVSGWAGRNRTLGLKKLEDLQVPFLPIGCQYSSTASRPRPAKPSHPRLHRAGRRGPDPRHAAQGLQWPGEGRVETVAFSRLEARRPRVLSRDSGFFSRWQDRSAAIQLFDLPPRSCSGGLFAREPAPSLRWRAC
jgi:hypothetical protein